jgi:hypothetical protein
MRTIVLKHILLLFAVIWLTPMAVDFSSEKYMVSTVATICLVTALTILNMLFRLIEEDGI